MHRKTLFVLFIAFAFPAASIGDGYTLTTPVNDSEFPKASPINAEGTHPTNRNAKIQLFDDSEVIATRTVYASGQPWDNEIDETFTPPGMGWQVGAGAVILLDDSDQIVTQRSFTILDL